MIIKTKNYKLRKIDHKEVNKKYFNWFKDEQINMYIDYKPKNLSELKKNVKEINKQKNIFFFGIFKKKTHIGNIKIFEINNKKKSARLGILIGNKSYRNKGIGLEVIEEIKKFLIKKDIRIVWLGLNPSNKNAFKLYKKAGFHTFKTTKKYLFMKCNLILSKVIIGGAQLNSSYGITNFDNKKQTKKDLNKILLLLKKENIFHLDGAENYRYFEKSLIRLNSNFKIDTKIKISEVLPLKALRNKLKKKYNKKGMMIDTLYIHDGDNVLKDLSYKKWKILNQLKKLKIISKIGISIYEYNNLEKILKKFEFNVVQLPYNLVDRRLEKFQNFFKKKKILIYVRSIFLQGALLRKIIDKNELKSIYDKVRKIGISQNVSNLSLCLNFVFYNDLIDKFIIGVRNPRELKQITNCNINLKQTKMNFSKKEIEFAKYPNKWNLNEIN